MRVALLIILLGTAGLGSCQSTDFEYVPQEAPLIPGEGRDDYNGGVIGVAHRFGAPKKKKEPEKAPKRNDGPRY